MWSQRARSSYADRARLFGYAAVATCAGVVLPGCAGGISASAPGPKLVAAASQAPPPVAQTRLSGRELAFVVRADLPPRQSLSIFRAQERIAQQCMASKGFRYPVEQHPVSDPIPPTTFRPTPSGRAPSESALLAYREAHGFTTATKHSQPTVGATETYVNSLPPARRRLWLRAWAGSPNDCSSHGVRVLFGSVAQQQADITAINDAYNFIINFIQTSPNVQAATQRWSSCLATATGRTWTNEPAAITAALATRRGNGGEPSSAEVMIAVADTRCAYSTGQASTYAQAVRDGAGAAPLGLMRSVAQAYRNYLAALSRSS